MSEVGLWDVLDLVNHVYRYDVLSLKKQSFLWHSNGFWCHTPLYLAVIKDLLTKETCLIKLCYIDNLQTEMDANKVREYIVLIRLCWSFNKLCSEIKAYSIKYDFLPQEGKWLCLESIVINKLLQLKHTSKQVDTGVKDRIKAILTPVNFEAANSTSLLTTLNGVCFFLVMITFTHRYMPPSIFMQ
jgi:hypothetical protein